VLDERYARQINLPEMGEAGQQKLKETSIVVIGAGGLGSPALLYLAAAGIGKITIVDGDIVDASNLHRQILYNEADIGAKKAEIAAKKLVDLNSQISIDCISEFIDKNNAKKIINGHDILIDGSDNIPTRYILDDICKEIGIPWVHASIHRFEGQIACFNISGSAGYRDLFPDPSAAENVPNCAEAGVLGVLPGIIGTIQATQALKICLGIGDNLAGKVLIVDTKTMKFRTMIYAPEIESQKVEKPQIITTIEADKRLNEGWKPFIIDCRGQNEAKVAKLKHNDLCIEHTHINNTIDQIPKNKDLLIYCHHGTRSMYAITVLMNQGFNGRNLYNLAGGIDSWSVNVDSSIRRY
jgi:adenylyltransferase/sulfurtransferase